MEDSSQWRLTTSNGIPYRCVRRGGSFSYEGAVASEEYIINASDLLAFVNFAFPEPYAVGGRLFYPQQPVMPGLGTLVPKSISWKEHVSGLPTDPFVSDSYAPAGTYGDHLLVTVKYGVAPENDSEVDPSDPFTFLQVRANASGVFLNSPNEGKATWTVPNWSPAPSTRTLSDGSSIAIDGEDNEVVMPNIPHTVVETQVEWSVKWPEIPWTFWTGEVMSRLRNALGKVNSTQMPLFQNAPTDTILFMGYQASAEYTWRAGRTGMSPITMNMTFLEKGFDHEEKDPDDNTQTVSVTHQHIWRPNWGWRRLKINGADLFAQSNLNNIWGDNGEQ